MATEETLFGLEDDVVVDIRDVSRAYRTRLATGSGSFKAVDRVSLRVRRETSVGIVGESGAGKSTLARMIVGLERPTAGSILVEGRNVEERLRRRRARREMARTIQMVYQDPYSALDPRQAIGVGLEEIVRLHFELSREDRRRRVESLLERVGLSVSYYTQKPGILSGGQRQRVAIARAIACDPKVLVLDEAVSALDVSVQGQILNLLQDLRRELEMVCIFISHDLAVIRQVCDEIVVMRNGVIVERGDTERVLSAPREEYTARLIAAVPTPGWVPRRRLS